MKYKKVKQTTKGKGFGGALMNEMLMSEIDDDDDDDYDVPELSEEEKQANKEKSISVLDGVKSVIVKEGFTAQEDADSAYQDLLEEYEDGYSVPSTSELVYAFLPDSVIQIDPDCFDEDELGYELLMDEF